MTMKTVERSKKAGADATMFATSELSADVVDGFRRDCLWMSVDGL